MSCLAEFELFIGQFGNFLDNIFSNRIFGEVNILLKTTTNCESKIAANDAGLRKKLLIYIATLLSLYSFQLIIRLTTMDIIFMNSLFRSLPFVLINIQMINGLFNYLMITSRLLLMQQSMLDTTSFYNVDRNVFHSSSEILEFPDVETVVFNGSLDKMKNKLIIKKIIIFKKIYFKCWSLQNICNDIFNWFIMMQFFEYTLSLIYLIVVIGHDTEEGDVVFSTTEYFGEFLNI